MTGRSSEVPIETRKTRRKSGSGQGGPARTAATPKTSAMRTIAPRFSGFWTLGQTTSVDHPEARLALGG